MKSSNKRKARVTLSREDDNGGSESPNSNEVVHKRRRFAMDSAPAHARLRRMASRASPSPSPSSSTADSTNASAHRRVNQLTAAAKRRRGRGRFDRPARLDSDGSDDSADETDEFIGPSQPRSRRVVQKDDVRNKRVASQGNRRQSGRFKPPKRSAIATAIVVSESDDEDDDDDDDGDGFGARGPSSSSSVSQRKASTPPTSMDDDDDDTATATADAYASDDDYESLRLKNIQANAALLASLGLFDASAKGAERHLAVEQAAKAPQKKNNHKTTTAKRPRQSVATRSFYGGDDASNDDPSTAHDEGVRRSQRTRVVSQRLQQGESHAKKTLTRRRREDSFIVSDSDDDAWSARDEDGDATDEEYFQRRVHSRVRATNTTTRKAQPLRRAARLGHRLHDPKRFGAIPGVQVGDWWMTRMACSTAAVHAPTVAGISGSPEDGCWSLCVSGGYEDDVDLGHTLTFTGSGGRALKGTKAAPKNLRTAPQSFDQSFDNSKNAALQKSAQTGRPIRVVRGFKGKKPYAPPEGYVYSGLYRVQESWFERGLSGFMMCKFRLTRLAGQPDLPTFEDEGVASGASPASSSSSENEASVIQRDKGNRRAPISISSSSRASSPLPRTPSTRSSTSTDAFIEHIIAQPRQPLGLPPRTSKPKASDFIPAIPYEGVASGWTEHLEWWVDMTGE